MHSAGLNKKPNATFVHLQKFDWSDIIENDKTGNTLRTITKKKQSLAIEHKTTTGWTSYRLKKLKLREEIHTTWGKLH